MSPAGSTRVEASCLAVTEEDTIGWGVRLGRSLKAGEIVLLFGDLGAGKTTLVKGIARGLGAADAEVCSPTFSYVNLYPGPIPLYHFDLYRLRDAEEFLAMGFEEMLFQGGICCIEWPERILPLLQEGATEVRLCHAGGGGRRIALIQGGKRGFGL